MGSEVSTNADPADGLILDIYPKLGIVAHLSVGMDLKDPEIANMPAAPLNERRALATLGARLCAAWERLKPLTVAAIEGWCVAAFCAPGSDSAHQCITAVISSWNCRTI